MIAKKTFLISERPRSNKDESVNHFTKTITISGNHKSIFTERKNTFAKEKNQIYFSVNRSGGNILQKAGNKLKIKTIILSSAGNILQEDYI